jgi:DNA polymerase eta
MIALYYIGYDWSRSKQAAFPFTRNITVDVIAGFADRLWKDLMGSSNKQDGSLPYSVTSIALGFSGVEPGEAGQQSIEGFFRSGPGTSTKSRSDPDPDQVDDNRQRIHRAKRQRETERTECSSDDILEIEHDDTASLVCPRCHKRIEVELGDNGDMTEERRAKALMEHSDFHVAEDLSKMPDDGINLRSPSQGLRVAESGRKRKRGRGTSVGKNRDPSDPSRAEGISKFLVRKPG